jgi:hypothetical protein
LINSLEYYQNKGKELLLYQITIVCSTKTLSKYKLSTIQGRIKMSEKKPSINPHTPQKPSPRSIPEHRSNGSKVPSFTTPKRPCN